MGSSNRRKKRREAERLRAEAAVVIPQVIEAPRENPPAVLRLVRSEGTSVSSEPDAAGRASQAVDPVREEIGSDDSSPKAESRPALVAAADNRPAVGLSRADVGRLVRRSFDATEINPILNDPSVFRFVAVERMSLSM